jgi:palmitoyltransferase
VSNFDHHCKFVNNCVGDKNYRIFIKLIIFLEVFSFFIVFVSLDFAWKVRVGPENLSVYLQVLTCGIILALNGMLIGFHVFLNCKKLTTFGYFERKTEFRANEQVELGHGKDLVNK